jgi:hypothetical protein
MDLIWWDNFLFGDYLGNLLEGRGSFDTLSDSFYLFEGFDVFLISLGGSYDA